MLASPLPSTDVTSDQSFSEVALIEQQHLTTAAPRRTSYSLYYHNNNEPEVYPEFNWENHSSIQLPNMGDPSRSESNAAEGKLHNSPLASALEPYQGAAPASPPSSRSETFNSDGGNVNLEICAAPQVPQDDSQAQEPLRVSNKRPRPPCLSQLDSRCFERYPQPHLTSANSSPRSAAEASLKKESEDLSSLPPIVTREEIERGVVSNSNKSVLHVPTAHLERHKHDLVAIDALGNSSVRRTPEANSNPHPQQLQFSNHSNGYLSALPSPVLPSCNGTNPGDRVSYPASPVVSLTAPNSATFPLESNSSFSPLTTASQANQVVSSPSNHHHVSDTAFSQTALPRLIRPSYASNGGTQVVDSSVAPTTGAPATRVTVSPAPQPAQASPWSSVETQAPRRRGKLPSAVTAILKGWLMAHTTHPYPTEEEKKSLCQETNLTMNQVSNWFINARRRILVPPSAGNSVHEVRQPVRRQAQSQLVRAAGHAGAVPPCLTIRHIGPQSVPASPSTSISMFSPVSATSPNLSNGVGSFDFSYPLAHQSGQENHYHGEGLSACRPTNTLSPCSSQWPHSTQLMRQSPSSPLYPQPHGPTPYYSSSHSFQGYPPSHSSSSTPLPSPHFSASFPSGPTHFPNTQARLHSPRPNPDSHPSTPTLSHSSNEHHSTPAYMSLAPCHPSISYPTNQDGEK
ncbi:hypothetical protein PGT21_032375 [Puccinia graminis f. sp. tritici]|uniref:Homeobox domain-containing protein n=1 Tax=Puccinia graminis f. sp. tritici TaxID=56615 RepID=A0A5B0QPC8_PUCGR|nr:hypothetical protein PGT21_032375 [Puccinia graminis f. sp. tritici]